MIAQPRRSGRCAARPTWARFQESIDKSGECWLWTGSQDANGYGQLWIDGRRERATHLALAFDGRPVPVGMKALHHCDNPPCVRPTHLFIGTQADNMADMRAKGRGHLPVRERQEVCKRGHAMTPDNVIVAKPPRHGRECRACKTLRNLSRVRS